ncbi:MAG: hypothetical protein A2571_03465 [Candidatus Vogelbacteria bacterium RIFOXYD1_FULL_44_32]|uniref:Uncharacterized protein n=1 Tax=Candidatus Vogelbacteria bacterium RIFOXYD1_FULL_44_32 TaxID=1802438 RepID=A0A1G2QCJ2_9BACT|nr:MAG: hypothetical protein A2571_03465 [Candidatus Vogelbacteria bacterium RIFOXYD1_FULL_44_32]
MPEKELLKPVYEVLQGLEMPDERIQEITEGLRSMGQSEAGFHKFHMSNLKKEYDLIEDRISKMYDDRLDGRITDEMYDRKLKEYKERQSAILTEMHIHSDADEEFYLTANMVLKLAQRALQIFKSSEVHEKRQFLNFLLQNCQLEGKNLTFSMRYPFDRILATSNQPIGLPRQGSNLRPIDYTNPKITPRGGLYHHHIPKNET